MLLTNNDRNFIEIIKTWSVPTFKKLFDGSQILVNKDLGFVQLITNNKPFKINIALYNNNENTSHYVVSHVKYHNQDMYLVHPIYDFTIKDEDFIKICEEEIINAFIQELELEFAF